MSKQDTFKLDHEFGLGDVLVIVLDLFLFAITIYRSWDFLNTANPTNFGVVQIAALWGLDFGVVVWSLVWMYWSDNKWQDSVAMAMWAADVLGVISAFMIDTLVFSGKNVAGVPAEVQNVVLVLVPLVILSNFIAGFFYHFTSERVKAARRKRRTEVELKKALLDEEYKHEQELANIKAEEESIRLREQRIALKRANLQQKLALDAEERAIRDAELDERSRAKVAATLTHKATNAFLNQYGLDGKAEKATVQDGDWDDAGKNGNGNHSSPLL